MVQKSTTSISPLLFTFKVSVPRVEVPSKALSTMALRRYSVKRIEPSKTNFKIREIPNRLFQTFNETLRKVFPPIKSSTSHRVISALNRFGPLQSINPAFMFQLQTTFRPYVTIAVSLVTSLLFLAAQFGTADSTMRLAAVPVRFWSGDETRVLTSPLLHTHAFHLLASSGFFLAFSTLVEVTAGPLALVTILLATAVVGTATAIATPERSANLYLEKVQMGLWPTILGLTAFYWTGIRKMAHSYLMKNPNLSRADKLSARQLSLQLSQRRFPLLLMVGWALLPMSGTNTTAAGGLAGGLVGALLGFMWTRSPHLVLINAAAVSAGALYLAKSPVWTLKFRAFKFARAWEDGEFMRAREWLHLFQTKSTALSPEQQQWTNVTMALVEMACGRTSVALSHAQAVDLDSMVTKQVLQRMKEQFAVDWKRENEKHKEVPKTNLAPSNAIEKIIDPARLASLQEYQSALKAAPWRTMNDEKILDLFYAAFVQDPQITPLERQNLILQHYQGLFDFDPTYERGQISKGKTPLHLPSKVTDNPLQ
jgi:membrane associated rhomboid family serine protease